MSSQTLNLASSAKQSLSTTDSYMTNLTSIFKSPNSHWLRSLLNLLISDALHKRTQVQVNLVLIISLTRSHSKTFIHLTSTSQLRVALVKTLSMKVTRRLHLTLSTKRNCILLTSLISL